VIFKVEEGRQVTPVEIEESREKDRSFPGEAWGRGGVVESSGTEGGLKKGGDPLADSEAYRGDRKLLKK